MLYVCIYAYIYICVCLYVHTCMYLSPGKDLWNAAVNLCSLMDRSWHRILSVSSHVFLDCSVGHLFSIHLKERVHCGQWAIHRLSTANGRTVKTCVSGVLLRCCRGETSASILLISVQFRIRSRPAMWTILIVLCQPNMCSIYVCKCVLFRIRF